MEADFYSHIAGFVNQEELRRRIVQDQVLSLKTKRKKLQILCIIAFIIRRRKRQALARQFRPTGLILMRYSTKYTFHSITIFII